MEKEASFHASTLTGTSIESSTEVDIFARELQLFEEDELPSEVRLVEDSTARRTEVEDVPSIRELERHWTTKLFGEFNGYDVIEDAILAITLETSTGSLVAHAAFTDYPLSDIVPCDKLDSWMQIRCPPEVNPLNAVFLRYFVCLKTVLKMCLKKILKNVFKTLVDVDYALIIIPKCITNDYGLASIFQEVYHQQQTDSFSLRSCIREKILPPLRIRRARVEDHDNLMQLFGKNVEIFTEHYGEYFLAELIEQQDQIDVCLAAENERGEIVGFMSISKNVDVALLEKYFHLSPFNNLRSMYIPKVEVVVPKKPVGVAAATVPASTAAVAAPTKTRREARREKTAPLPQPADTAVTLSESTKVEEAKPEEPAVREPSKFSAKESVFCIHLFIIRDDYEMSYMNLLVEAFRVFSDLEFCILSMATWSLSTPLLQKFVRVSPVLSSPFPQELFLCHRWGFLKSFKIRMACVADIQRLSSFLDNMHSSKHVISMFERACHYHCDTEFNELLAFVAECNGQLVGAAVICREYEIDYIQSHFNIEDHIYFGLHKLEDHARVLQFVLYPLFSHWNRLFLKDIMRLGKKSCLYIRIYNSPEQTAQYDTMSVVGEFLSISRRNNIFLPEGAHEANVPAQCCTYSKENKFMLSMLSRKHVLETKMKMRSIIVIVGCSQTALSFIRTLLDRPFVTHANLYLVSPTGVPDYEGQDEILKIILPPDLTCPLQEMHASYIKSRVSLIKGFMTGIHRDKKLITIDKNFQVPYDLLILCCGKQYQIPNIFMNPYDENLPRNVYVVNTQNDAILLLDDIDFYFKSTKESEYRDVVIYGNTIDAYIFVEGLIENQVPPEHIVLVEPTVVSQGFCIHGEVVPPVLHEQLLEERIRHYKNYDVDEALIKFTEDEMRSIDIRSYSGGRARLHVKFLIAFCQKDVNYNTFVALNDASLVYDKGLVIDREFRTNDPWIFAAGSLTKFSRKYYNEFSPHACRFNSIKTGKQLGLQICRILNPMGESSESWKHSAVLMQELTGPVIMHGQLPRTMHYFHMCSTGECMEVPKEDEQNDEFMLETGVPIGNGRCPYVRMIFNKHRRISSITCLSQQEFNAELWVKLFGYNIQFLNNLSSRFDDGSITDLYGFFTEPWCCALLLDRFNDYWKETKRMINLTLGKNSTSALILKNAARQKRELDWNEKVKLRQVLEKESSKDVASLLINFLHYNQNLLPMYALPDIV